MGQLLKSFQSEEKKVEVSKTAARNPYLFINPNKKDGCQERKL